MRSAAADGGSCDGDGIRKHALQTIHRTYLRTIKYSENC